MASTPPSMPCAPPSTCDVDRAIGVDLGSRRIGIAVSSGRVATPYEVIPRSGDRRADHRRIGDVVADTGAALIVVGLPLSMDGTEGRAARKARIEAGQLAENLAIRVELWDERLTTVTAEDSLKAQGLNAPQRREVVDKVAASIILQSWLDANHRPRPEEF